jgi:hypothetical protein
MVGGARKGMVRNVTTVFTLVPATEQKGSEVADTHLVLSYDVSSALLGKRVLTGCEPGSGGR